MERVFKYHGLGNDFVVVDRRASGVDLDAATAVRWCDRRRGIGADGVLVVLPSGVAAARMVVHNADGSQAEMCGNGLRCVVKFLVDHGVERPDSIDVETGAGVLTCAVRYVAGAAEEITVSMGPARLVASNLPSGKTGAPFVEGPLPVPGGTVRGTAVSLGNPHLVVFERGPEDASTLGPVLERAPGFPDRTNVELCRISGEALKVTVWERGVGLTQACGTGACAAVAAAVHEGRLPPGKWIPVTLPGGMLHIRSAEDLSRVELRGPATFVFEAVVPDVSTP